jgi:hypothetical protein
MKTALEIDSSISRASISLVCDARALAPLCDRLLVRAIALGQRPQASLPPLSRSTDRLYRGGAPLKNLADEEPGAQRIPGEENAPLRAARGKARCAPGRSARDAAFGGVAPLPGSRGVSRPVPCPARACYSGAMNETRIDRRFARTRAEGRAALVTFLMAGDPDPSTYEAILAALPDAGADVIEIGMPFTDPMADGPSIQAAGLRALKGGQTLVRTLAMVEAFRARDPDTPIVLMGYYNPIYVHGVERFLAEARAAGVDGLIVVDLPPEEDAELCLPARAAGLNFIRLATPTTCPRC